MKRVLSALGVGLVVGVLGLAVVAAPIKIGITKIVEHPALDAVERGVIDALAAAGYVEGVNVEYLRASAQGDPGIAVTIAEDYKARGVALVVAIATPSAQAAAQVFRNSSTPVIYAAVTDPVGVGLVPSATDPNRNGNVTGASDMIPVASHLRLLRDLGPDIRRIGMVYNPGEANSAILTELAQEAAPGLGLEIVTAAADSTANVPMAAQSLIGRVDAYYVTTDNAVVSAIDSVLAASEEAGVPFLVADPTSLEHATMSAGFDYYEHGLLAGSVVLQVLSGARPDTIPVTYQSQAEVQLNLDQAARIGLSFPAAVIDAASTLYYGSSPWNKDSD